MSLCADTNNNKSNKSEITLNIIGAVGSAYDNMFGINQFEIDDESDNDGTLVIHENEYDDSNGIQLNNFLEHSIKL